MSSPSWFTPDAREQAQFAAGILTPFPPDQLLSGRYQFDWSGLVANAPGQFRPSWIVQSGDAVLDLTDPQLPTFINAGVYAVSATVWGSPTTASTGSFYAELDFDVDGDDVGSSWGNVPIGDTNQGFGIALPLTFYAPAGFTVSLDLAHDDTTQTIGGRCYVIIQQVA